MLARQSGEPGQEPTWATPVGVATWTTRPVSAAQLPLMISRGSVNQKVLPARRAVGPDGAAHQGHQLLADRQAQPRAVVPAGAGGVGLGEGLEQRGQLLAGIPMPESSTRKRTSAVSVVAPTRSTDRRTCPSSVNLQAFRTRFVRTCEMRIASPARCWGSSGSTLAVRVRPFASAIGAGRHVLDVGGESEVSRRPAVDGPGLEAGEVEDVVDQPEQAVAGTLDDLHEWPAPRPVEVASASISVAPSTLVSGVRTSWLMFARNSDLVVLASSAAWRVRSSSRRISLRSVTSSATPCTPTTSSHTIDRHGRQAELDQVPVPVQHPRLQLLGVRLTTSTKAISTRGRSSGCDEVGEAHLAQLVQGVAAQLWAAGFASSKRPSRSSEKAACGL